MVSSDICYIYSDPAEIEEFDVVLSGDCIGRIPRVGDIYPSSQHDFGLLKISDSHHQPVIPCKISCRTHRKSEHLIRKNITA